MTAQEIGVMKGPAHDKDFIVSFKEGDRAWAELAARVLKEAGYDVELRAWAYKDSEFFLDEVKQYASGGPALIPILTPAYMTTIHAEPKWFEAYQHGYFRVLPIQVKNCDISSLLHMSKYVDWRYYDEQISNAVLVEDAERHFGKPSNPPAPKARPKPTAVAAPAGPSMATIQPVRRLPFEREMRFTGRKDVLKAIGQTLERHHTAVVVTDASAGPGNGRRKLAIEYACLNAQQYKLIWGMRAENPAVLQDDFARLAATIGLPEQGARDLAFSVQAVRRWLDRNPGWLLVFQNAVDYGSLRSYLPNPAMGHVLISSEHGHWPQAPAPITLKRWTAEEATAFVERSCDEPDGAYAKALAKELHCHALSIKLALALMERQGWSLSEACEQLAAQRGVMSEYDGQGGADQFALARVLCLILQALQERDPEAFRFVKGFAYLDAFNIMPTLLARGAKALPKELARDVNDPATLERCMNLLTDFGVVETTSSSLFFHGMIQSQVRAWLEGSLSSSIHACLPGLAEQHSFSLARPSGPMWCKASLAVIRAVFPEDPENPKNWNRCALLLAHAYAVLGHAERLEVDAAGQADLWYRLGSYFLARESVESAHAAMRTALSVAESAHGSRHASVTRALKGVGIASAYLEHYEEAIGCFKRLMESERGLLGGSGSDGTESVVLLGDCYLKTGQADEALGCYQDALQRDKARHGGAHPDIMRDFLLIGDAYREMTDLTRAWSYYEQAQLVQQTIQALGAKEEAEIGRRLGALHHAMGDLRNARSYLQHTVQLYEKAEGPGSAAAAKILAELGEIEEHLGEPAEARKLFKKAMRIDEALFGPEDVRVAVHAERLARTAIALQQPAKARPALQRALEIYEAHHGQDHQKTMEVREALKKVS